MDREQAMKPRVLLAEDDPTTAAVFGEVLAGAGYRVDTAPTWARVEGLARAGRHALWLLDAHLPDGHACAWLPRLHATHGRAVPAVAHTASADAAAHARLLAAGFAAVLAKPCPAAVLLTCVARQLRPRVRDGADGAWPVHRPAWDDAAAACALGGAASVAGLRRRFLDDLPREIAAVAGAASRGDAQAMAGTLHRLAAACAYAGAPALAAAVAGLQAAPGDAGALRTLVEAATALRTAR